MRPRLGRRACAAFLLSAWGAAAALPAFVAPPARPGGNPVIAFPGLTPIEPLRTDEPVLVMVEPARTEYGPAVPRPTEFS